MLVFETILVLLFGATILSALARRMHVPYPTLLALGGAAIAFLPGAPELNLPPELIMALFVAPVLVDAAFDASFRDLKRNWAPVLSLVLVAVGLTTVCVAIAARMLLPDLPWPAAIALGALVAPPDAVAALAVLRHANPPHRLRMVLEGESLLNDATALLLYRLAVGAAAAGGFSVAEAAPTFAVVVVGSVAVGYGLARLLPLVFNHVHDAPSTVILQFVGAFAVWLLAERLHLSGVVTVVVFGLTAARSSASPMPARLRVPSWAIWETTTVVLNVLAFTLVGLQIRPILEALSAAERVQHLVAALAVLAVVILVRIVWVMTHHGLASAIRRTDPDRPDVKGAVVMSWSGMRGVVTLAAAMALPAGFPYRDFIHLTAFVVVLGTLVIQGATLRPLLALLRLPKDTTVEAELGLARTAGLQAALSSLADEDCPAARRLKLEYGEALAVARDGGDPRNRADNRLRLQSVAAARQAISDMRRSGEIGDDAYRRVEEELDRLELSAQPTDG